MTSQLERGGRTVQTDNDMRYLYILFLLCPPLTLGDRDFEDHEREERGRGGGGGSQNGGNRNRHGGNKNKHSRINFEDSDEIKHLTPDDDPGAVARLLEVDVSTLTATQTLGVSCKDPQDREGVCSYITDPKCANLNRGLRSKNKRKKSLTLQYVDKASDAPCGYDGTDLTVCCLAHPPPKHPPHQHKRHQRQKKKHPAAKRPKPRPKRPEKTTTTEGSQPPPPSPPPPPEEATVETCGIRQVPTLESAVSKREAEDNLVKSRVIRTVGGVQAPKGYFPWAGVLGQPDPLSSGGFKIICGSTLLTHQHVLTAAHCFPDKATAAQKITHVRLGQQDLTAAVDGDTATPIDAKICEIEKHEDFVENTSVENDVAILTLCDPVEYTKFIQPACLPAAGAEPAGTLTIAGWGSEYYGGAPVTALNQADVVRVPLTECQKEYEVIGGKIDDSHICAGKGKTDSCAGDSGGPMLEQVHDSWTVVGITSFGVGCANENFPGVYTNVAQFIEWITTRLD